MMTKFRYLPRLLEKYRLVLASGSPRRVKILTAAGIPFRQIIPDINEENHSALNPEQLATILAEHKAEAVLEQIGSDEIILGCDTIVILEGRILGKPASRNEAFSMLSALSGNRHTVCSAIALLDKQRRRTSSYELSDVYFNRLTNDQIGDYINTGEPMDKAGAYGIQEKGGFLVDRVAGNIDNVTGLPMALFDELAGRILGE